MILQSIKMREAFSEHFVGESERQQKLWADCIFVLDTNVLLDLYRFSDSAREALFKVMESLGERLWIPYQVAAEYFENRLGVIEDQSDAYAKSISGLKIAKEKFNSGSRHPFVSDKVFDQFISSYDLMIKELEGKQKTYLSFVGDDVIKAKIGTLLNGKVGEPYSEERLQEVAGEGEKRYLENIPPGFQDGGKMPEATTTKLRLKKFGDLIIWRQVIEKAMAAKKPVILVTGEKKDDWWLRSDKRLVSALPALTKEFMDSVKQDFYLYATDRFLLKANEYLKQSTSAVVVEEVRELALMEAAGPEKISNSEEDEILLDGLRSNGHGQGERFYSSDFSIFSSGDYRQLLEEEDGFKEKLRACRRRIQHYKSVLKAVEDGARLSDSSRDRVDGELAELAVKYDFYRERLAYIRSMLSRLREENIT